MATDLILPSFSNGELSPDLFGRVDLQAFHRSAATMRNMFVNYKGGASSRAGTAFVGRCKQPGTSLPPRDIPFRYSLDINYVLEFGEQYMRVKYQGAYITESGFTVTDATQANPCVLTVPGHNFSPGDWIFVNNVEGMTELNERTFIIQSVNGDDIILRSILEAPVNSINYSAYTVGGTASRIFTLQTPYISEHLAELKFDQRPTIMTLTHRSYEQRELVLIEPDNWTLSVVDFGATIDAPASMSATTSATTTSNPAGYQYVATAVSAETGEESVASPIAGVTNSININSVLGSIALAWDAVDGAGSYNIYKAPVAANGEVPTGVLFGYIGTSNGLSFVDSNIIADFSLTPPLANNPFAISKVIGINVTAGGSGYTSATTATITSATGSGAVLRPVIVSGAVAAVIIENGGEGYNASDTITFSVGSGATATLEVGPSSGTYPGVVAYFQQRIVYANTDNEPDTYWMSRPGQYDNFDFSQISRDDDMISGTPWARQINGIQFLVPMPGGLVILTGLGAWQLSGTGQGAAVTPADQNAQPQASNGCHQHIPPIVINYDILYVQSKGSIVRNLAYNLLSNIYAGTDITILSSHLFENWQIEQWAWAEEPYKIVWAVRSDGRLLSLTFLKEQEIQGWARHDTKGQFVSVCSVSEPPIDAVYFIVKRYINGSWYYYSERMNDRLWENIEDVWALDCGLKLTQPTPAANIQASASVGPGEISAVNVLLGGSSYSSTPSLNIIDPAGSGASVSATVVGGVITAVTVNDPGEGYTAPQIVVTDATGQGASFSVDVSNAVSIQADANVFTSDNVGDVIRLGGGIGTITEYISPRIVKIDLGVPITDVVPDDPDNMPLPVPSGEWTMTTPVDELTNLEHLEGQRISFLADGAVVQDILVENGSAILPQAASSIVGGLPFTAQIQSLFTDIPGEETIQTKRKNIYQVGVRVKASRGVAVGANQIDSSTVQNFATIPWSKLTEVRDRSNTIHAGRAIPLYTGDYVVNIAPSWNRRGQVACQQSYPLPMNILAFVPDVVVGDNNG